MVFCSFLFVRSYHIQIHISEAISTERRTRLPLRLQEVVEMYGPTIFHLSYLFGLFSRERVPHSAQTMAAGACGRSPAEIVGSNPTGGMDICLL